MDRFEQLSHIRIAMGNALGATRTEKEDAKLWTLAGMLLDYAGDHAAANGGRLPKEVFHGVARNLGMNIVELVPVRRVTGGGWDILYIRRPPDDPEFQGVHTPGTGQRTWRGAEETVQMALARLVRSELGDGVILRTVVDLGRFEAVVPPRGMESAQVFLAVVEGDAREGEWVPYETLPPDLLAYQRATIVPFAQKWIRTNL